MREESRKPNDLRHRIALSNRTRLPVGPAKLEAVAANLARSRSERAHFLDDPTAYLKANALPVSSCSLARPLDRPAQTSETVAAVVVCNATLLTCGPLMIMDACAFVTCDINMFVVALVIGYEASNHFAEAPEEPKIASSDDLFHPGHSSLL